jgi:hypothetical protein
MATYLVLINFTEQGIRNIKDSPKRAAAATELARDFGIFCCSSGRLAPACAHDGRRGADAFEERRGLTVASLATG